MTTCDHKSAPSAIPWRCCNRLLELGVKTRIMGVLNVTPDSFSDGGQFLDRDSAIRHGMTMAEAGAEIIDVGGESTRPGSSGVSADDERARVVPVIRSLARNTDALVSVDTRKSAVAAEALENGAHIINDVSAMSADPAMVGLAKASGAGVVLMHMQGTPGTMQENPEYEDVVSEVRGYLSARRSFLVETGLSPDHIALDPGIGFGKTVKHNLLLLAHLRDACGPGVPILVGVSRKSFLGKLTGQDVDQRLVSSLAAMAYAIMRGAHIIRVHDVKESCDVACVVDMLRVQERPHGMAGENREP